VADKIWQQVENVL